MKTVIIYNQFTELLSFIVLEGDHERLDGVVINSCEVYQHLQDELYALLYNEQGEFTQAASTFDKFPTEEVKNGAKVIVCGFLP